jgi:putative ABC transport system substrate-binding protein
MVKRRKFITLLGSAAAWPLAGSYSAAAQSGRKVWRIGYLSGMYGQTELSQSFVQGLRGLGYVDGQNLIVEYRFASGKNERLPELATDLVRERVDLITTEGTPSTLAAMHATRTIPIVFGSAQDPIEKGIVASLAYPGGNVTGNALIADHSKPLELLKQAVPKVSQVTFIYDPATRPGTYGEAKLKELQNHARTVDIEVHAVALRAPDETARVFATLPIGTDAILLENSAVNLLAQERLCTLAAQRRLPAVSTFGEFADAGCLMSYGEDLPDVYRRAATYVDKIFRGTTPADLPVQQPVTFQLIINLRAAKALSLAMPELLLVRADKVIE